MNILNNLTILKIILSLIIHLSDTKVVQAKEGEVLMSESEIVEVINNERLKNNLPKYKINDSLEKSADIKADDMLIKNYWSHYSPDGQAPWSIIQNVGYSYKLAGENLAEGYTSPEEVVQAWMDSPAHKANLLNNNFNEIGISVKTGKLLGEPTTLVVTHFGLRKDQKILFN